MKPKTLNTITGTLIVLSVLAGCSDKHVSTNYRNDTRINKAIDHKLAKASWTNVGDIVLVCDEGVNSDLIDAVICELHLDKDMFRGREKARNVDDFINLVNKKYEMKIRLIHYSEDANLINLKYEDGSSVIWDYIDRRAFTRH